MQCSKVLSYGHKPSKHTLCGKHRAEAAAGVPFTAYRKYIRARGSTCTARGNAWVCSLPTFQGNDLCKKHWYQQYAGRELSPVVQVESSYRDSAGRKHCYVCDAWLDPSEFESTPVSTRRSDGLRASCRLCHSMSGYGITGADYRRMLADQDGACAVCRTSEPGTNSNSVIKRFAVDHDHACCPQSSKSCGKCVRGLLCRSCNVALGTTRDNVDTLIHMIEYLIQYKDIHTSYTERTE